MKVPRQAGILALVCTLGVALMTSTTPTVAYNVVSSPEPAPRPHVGVLFSNSYNYYYHYYHHFGKANRAGAEEPRIPAKFFDRK